jgi:hypothetical protein
MTAYNAVSHGPNWRRLPRLRCRCGLPWPCTDRRMERVVRQLAAEATRSDHPVPAARVGTCGCSRPLSWDPVVGRWEHIGDGTPCVPPRVDPSRGVVNDATAPRVAS